MFVFVEDSQVTKYMNFKNSPIDKTVDIVFKNHVHFFFHLLLQRKYKNNHWFVFYSMYMQNLK